MLNIGSISVSFLTAICGWTLMSGNLGLSTSMPITQSYASSLPVERGIDGRLYMKVDINGKSVRVIVDTAASHSVLRSEDARLAEVMITGETRLRTAGGNSLLVAGTHFENHRVLIAEHLPISLLGMDVLQTLKGTTITL